MAFKVKRYRVEESNAWVTFWLLVTVGALCFCAVVWLIVLGVLGQLVDSDPRAFVHVSLVITRVYCLITCLIGGFFFWFAEIVPHHSRRRS